MVRTTLLSVFFLFGCSADNPKKHYILAEKLWGKGDYLAAVAEFDRVTRKDSKGKLGLQALYRSAMTQTIFLSQHQEAIQKFKTYIEKVGDSAEAWAAELQIGEILFSKLNSYDQAILHYKTLLEKKSNAIETPEFLFRIAKSHFYLWEFEQAILRYKEIENRFPNSIWAEKAAFEIGVSYFTGGEQRPDGEGPGMDIYRSSIQAYESFIKKYPNSEFVQQAHFGIAACLEELDQLDAAYEKYASLKTTYPSQKIISIKLARIKERQSIRKR